MKRLLLIVLLFLIIISGFFYKQILATVDFYQFQKDHKVEFVKAMIDWRQFPFTSATTASRASDSLPFGSLIFPVPYGVTKSVGEQAAFATGYTELITITHSSAAADFFRMYNFSADEQQATCAFLSQTSGRGACSSNYDFYRAYLRLNQSDTNIFTSIQNKELHKSLMLIRAEDIPTNTVSAFETSNLRGFIFTINQKKFVVELFDQQDQQYHLEFEGLKESDVAFVLSNTTQNK